MPKKTVYVILWTPVKKLADMMPYLEDHLRWLIELEKEGVVFASGPFLGEGDEIPGTGMTMLPADSCAKAEEIAKQDHLAGTVCALMKFAPGRSTMERSQ